MPPYSTPTEDVADTTPLFACRGPLRALIVRPESVPRDVSDEEVTPLASMLPVSVPAGATTATVPAAVISPLPFTVKVGIAVELPQLPVSVLTVARVATVEPGPLAVTSPVSAVR